MRTRKTVSKDDAQRFERKVKLRERLVAVIKEASARGLRCEEIPADEPRSYRFRKRLLIQGRKCQIVSSRIVCVDGVSSQHTLYHPYLPSTNWADFLIHVASDENQPESLSFFVVPRGEIAKSTVLCSPENWLLRYKDAWSLLADELPATRLARRPELFNWKLAFVMQRAAVLGFDVELVKKAAKNQHVQNRLLINGRRCQTMALARLSSEARNERWSYVTLHASTQTWAEFLIFLLRTAGSDDVHVFIIPRQHVQRTTTTSLKAKWLIEYADNWELLRTERSAVCDQVGGEAGEEM